MRQVLLFAPLAEEERPKALPKRRKASPCAVCRCRTVLTCPWCALPVCKLHTCPSRCATKAEARVDLRIAEEVLQEVESPTVGVSMGAPNSLMRRAQIYGRAWADAQAQVVLLMDRFIERDDELAELKRLFDNPDRWDEARRYLTFLVERK